MLVDGGEDRRGEVRIVLDGERGAVVDDVSDIGLVDAEAECDCGDDLRGVGVSPFVSLICYGWWDTYSDLSGVHEAVLGGVAGGLIHAGVVGEGLDTGSLEESRDDFSCLVSIVSDW